jgi:hypothetical protein
MMRFAFWRRHEPPPPPPDREIEVDDRPDPDVQLLAAQEQVEQLESLHTQIKALAEPATRRIQDNHISEAVEAWFGSRRPPRPRPRRHA